MAYLISSAFPLGRLLRFQTYQSRFVALSQVTGWHSEQHFCFQDKSLEAAINKLVLANSPSMKDFPAAGTVSLAIRTI
jgi:hypothetical protein